MLRAPGWAHLIPGPIHAGFAIEVQVDEGGGDEYQRNRVAYSSNPGCVSSGASGRRAGPFARPVEPIPGAQRCGMTPRVP
eukprot:6277447-Prymnesium_polylepis.1